MKSGPKIDQIKLILVKKSWSRHKVGQKSHDPVEKPAEKSHDPVKKLTEKNHDPVGKPVEI